MGPEYPPDNVNRWEYFWDHVTKVRGEYRNASTNSRELPFRYSARGVTHNKILPVRCPGNTVI